MVFRNYLFDSSTAYDSSRPTFNIRTATTIDRFKVLEVLIPSSWYSTGTNNNQVSITIGANTYLVTIPPGNYNVSNFPAVLSTALTSAIANGWNVTYNDVSKALTITGTTAFTVNNFTQGTSSYKQLGLDKFAINGSATSFTGSVIDLSGISSLLLTSSQLSSRDITFAGYSHINVLCKVDITSGPGSYIHWKNPGSYVSAGIDINFIDFQWLDSSTMLPVSLNGKSFSLSLGTVGEEDDLVMIV